MLVIALLAALIENTYSSNSVHRFDTSTSDLASLLDTAHFVDKTDIVKSFFQSAGMIMVTGPRRFGKSTNLGIIKRFCEITVDNKGNRVQRNLTENYKLFTTNRLNIYTNDRVFFVNNFGIYPVIYVDFLRLRCTSFEEFLSSFRSIIFEEFEIHYYLLSSCMLRKSQITKLEKYFDEFVHNNVSETDLLDSLLFLSELLFIHFDRTKCIVLIDEYDGPVQETIFLSCTDLDLIIDFIRKFISITLKGNAYVERGFITGCVRLAVVTLTDANNIQHIPFLEDRTFSQFYGFREEEIKLLLTKLNMADKLNGIRQWYGRYYVRDSNITIYNPISIVEYLDYKKFRRYWVNTGYVENLGKIFLHKNVSKKISQLLLDKTISISTAGQLEVGHIVKLNDIVKQNQSLKLSENDADLFLEFMTDLGYFNILLRGKEKIVVKIPNYEIKTEIGDSFYTVSVFKEILNIKQKDIDFYVNALSELGKNKTTFVTFAQSVANIHASLPRMPENEPHFQHALWYFAFYKFRFVNKEPFPIRERFDFLIMRKDLIALRIELQYGDGSAYDALKQIIEKKYDVWKEECKFYGIKEFILAGLHISKNKRCDMSYVTNTTDIKKANNVTVFYV